MSLDPEVRLGTVQTGNPDQLGLIDKWAVQYMHSMEAGLHQWFEARKVENKSVREWFDLTSGTGDEENDSMEEGISVDVKAVAKWVERAIEKMKG